MKILFLVVGKTKIPFWREAEAEYLKRLKKFVPVEYAITKERSAEKSQSVVSIIEREGKDLLAYIQKDDFVVVLDKEEKQYSSEVLAKRIEEWQQHKRMVFVIGGTYGISKEVLTRANEHWSLSWLTFTQNLSKNPLWQAASSSHGSW